MGNMAGYRAQWLEATEYVRDLETYEQKRLAGDKDAKPPKRDLKLDTLAGVLKGEILVQMHCYRAEEMAAVIDMSKEFGYHVTAFHHGVEAYKISNLLAENGICGALWADWWGFKMEAFDAVQENLAFVDAAPNGLRDRAFGFGGGHPAAEPGSRRRRWRSARSVGLRFRRSARSSGSR